MIPSSPITRRDLLHHAAGGFLGVALGGVMAQAGELPNLALNGGPHFTPRAKSVIYLFMCGGVSHLDTFDPKGNKWAGKLVDVIGFGDNRAQMKRPVIPCHRTFTPCGQSGTPVSDWFPHIGGVIDDIAVVRSMWCNEPNHFPAVIENCTAHRGRQFDHPTLGSWITYALGSVNQNLPAFVNIGRPSSPVQLTGGYLGAGVAATPFQSGDTPIPNLQPPPGASAAERERQMQALAEMNRAFRERYAINSDIAARAKAYELAGRMQLSAPEAVDFAKEPQHVLDLYGIGQSATDEFGRRLLLARRLVERGVRFIQVCHAGGGNGGWDAHADINAHAPLCKATDQPDRRAGSAICRREPRPARRNARRLVYRVRPGTPWSQNTTGPRPQSQGLHPLAGRRRHQRRHRARARPTTPTASTPSNTATTTATCTPRFSPSLRPRPPQNAARKSSAARCGSLEEGGGPIKEIIR